MLYIESCTLGCGNGVGGNQVTCEIVGVGRNVEISLLFSEAVDGSSLNNSTIQIINATTSQVPAFNFSIDPNNPRRVLVRPNLTFDSLGNPNFALGPDETYEITIPGVSQGDSGPFVRSITGRQNLSRLRCTIRTTEGIIDAVPGSPTVSVFVDTLAANNVPAQNAFDVKSDSSVRMVFNDIMNPATLANPSTQLATFVTTKVDTDGNINTTTDQVTVAGAYTWVVDFNALRTTMTFVPQAGFPSRGSNPGAPRRILMDFPVNILDLVGNPLGNPGKVVFTPEFFPFTPLTLPDEDGENFVDTLNEDTANSGAAWGNSSLGGVSGRLTFGRTGGSGRLGRLTVPAGQTVILNTDSQEFPLGTQTWGLLDNSVQGDYNPVDPSSWPRITITDGAFEFSQLTIESNGRLVLVGSNPGRVYSRGQLQINGILDVAGETPVPHQSNDWRGNAATWPANVNFDVVLGGDGGTGGASGGSGGDGGDRYDTTGLGFPNFPGASTGNIFLPGDPPDNPGVDNLGKPGVGIGQFFPTGGPGGSFYPTVPPTSNLLTNPGIGNLSLSLVNIGGSTVECRVAMVGAPGGGGAYALDGGAAAPASPHPAAQTFGGGTPPPSVPPPTAGGDNSSLALEAPGLSIRRALNFEQGNLVGGSGGGGGGMHLWGTKGGSAPPNCFGAGVVFPFWDHSGAGGGGGGGAVQVNSGRTLLVNGVIDASGGAGGSSTQPGAPMTVCLTNGQQGEPANVLACGSFAAPGGGGSGGAIKLKGRAITLSAVPGRVSVAGGIGGSGVGGSIGGAGSPGLVRLEYRERPLGTANPGNAANDAAIYAPSISPTSAAPSFNSPFASAAILSISGLPLQRQRPDSFTASQSCWMKPEGNFFQLAFDPDGAGTTPEDMAWNMDIVYLAPSGDTVLFPYRGIPDPEPAEFPLVGQSFEDFFGNMLNHGLPDNVGSVVAVRFQGARSTGSLPDPCNVVLSGVSSQIAPGSLTPWVRHPVELNAFVPQPNMVRFTVVLEESLKNPAFNPIASRVLGITNLSIGVTPD